jgi:hypothetical protein
LGQAQGSGTLSLRAEMVLPSVTMRFTPLEPLAALNTSLWAALNDRERPFAAGQAHDRGGATQALRPQAFTDVHARRWGTSVGVPDAQRDAQSGGAPDVGSAGKVGPCRWKEYSRVWRCGSSLEQRVTWRHQVEAPRGCVGGGGGGGVVSWSRPRGGGGGGGAGAEGARDGYKHPYLWSAILRYVAR